MRVHVISDVHGAAGQLPGAAEGADALLCLGDLLLFVDYADHGQGIFADLFGAEAARQFVALRTAKQFDEARAMSAGLWQRLKLCHNADCRAAFFDTSRNNSGVWHDVSTCGNTANLRAFRERKRLLGNSGSQPGPPGLH